MRQIHSQLAFVAQQRHYGCVACMNILIAINPLFLLAILHSFDCASHFSLVELSSALGLFVSITNPSCVNGGDLHTAGLFVDRDL